MSDGFLFPEDAALEKRRREWEKQSKIYGTYEFEIEYARYIKSAQWRKLCKLVKKRARNRCEQCIHGEILVGRLSVHHKTYDRFKNERLTDLELLCTRHHDLADKKRKQRVQDDYEARGEEMRESAALNTFMTKKYGDDWADRIGYDMARAWEEFEEWLERKAEQEGYDY